MKNFKVIFDCHHTISIILNNYLQVRYIHRQYKPQISNVDGKKLVEANNNIDSRNDEHRMDRHLAVVFSECNHFINNGRAESNP